MVLINIARIQKLLTEAHLRKHVVSTYSYGPKSQMHADLDDAMAISFHRMYDQAYNLVDKLKDLHTACTNLASGNIQKYYDQHMLDVGDSEPFDPYFEITYNFDGENVTDLPETIEQYDELYRMSLQYAAVREVADKALDNLFGGEVPWQVPIQENGETVYVPMKDLPQDFVEEIKINEQITNIETEYALDGYNQFYGLCMQSIQRNKVSGNWQDCAIEILSMMTLQ